MKFFKFLERRKQTADERIGFLANELIKELKKSGRSIECDNVVDGSFGNFNIWVFGLGQDEPKVVIEKIGRWKVTVKPTFDEF